MKFDPPREVRGRTYDDAVFVASLREQVQAGRALSPRQVEVLDRLLARYAQQIPDYERRVAEWGGGAADAGAGSADPAECEAVLAALAGVKEWKPAVQRGRRVWDDRKFHDSIARQFRQKKSLSPRQLASLRKMAARYKVLPAAPKADVAQ